MCYDSIEMQRFFIVEPIFFYKKISLSGHVVTQSWVQKLTSESRRHKNRYISFDFEIPS